MSVKKEDQFSIPLKEKISIEISGYFHRQLVASYFNVISLIGNEKTEEITKALANNAIEDLSEQDQSLAVTIHSFIALIKTTEIAFKDAGLVVKESVDLPNEDSES